eukprot:CAMPEP_0172510360 /NCGR_PEP_ID=MMETSP1066-20121228/227794_1 /TAXON_ID=671091 /ORGANISM="Coscinodiscus wailesii, Strain CCMP2513" /LENGTH=101 /DNA_ID=CAMNT_0013289273 /DNA_START=293 /DNA_END=598 /DNA_ORIENTATION=-
MLGRLNAAMNQAVNLDDNIDDLLEHFVYVPKKCTANAQDVPFFLSTRVSDSEFESVRAAGVGGATTTTGAITSGDPVKVLADYESRITELAAKFENGMVRF